MKRQYIAAVAWLMAGAIGFVGVYSTERAQDRKQRQQLAQEEQQRTEQRISEVSSILEPKVEDSVEQKEVKETEETEQKEEEKATETMAEPKVEPAVEEKLHFAGKKSGLWPLDGKILLPYSMNATIYFPTLDQYQYNPAMVIQGNINDKVVFIAKGKIKDITTNEETGCTVTQDLGDGYTAIYGQLKELTFDKGDDVECGQVVGYVSEPTKYYSVEGSNLYFAMKKDGKPIDPTEYLCDK